MRNDPQTRSISPNPGPAALDGSGALAGPWTFDPEHCREYARRVGGFIVAQAWQEPDGWRWCTFRKDGRLPPSRGPVPSLRAAQAAADGRLQARGLRLSTAPALMAVAALEPEPEPLEEVREATGRVAGILAHTVGRRCMSVGLTTPDARAEVRRLCEAVGASDALAELDRLPALPEPRGARVGPSTPAPRPRLALAGNLIPFRPRGHA